MPVNWLEGRQLYFQMTTGSKGDSGWNHLWIYGFWKMISGCCPENDRREKIHFSTSSQPRPIYPSMRTDHLFGGSNSECSRQSRRPESRSCIPAICLDCDVGTWSPETRRGAIKSGERVLCLEGAGASYTVYVHSTLDAYCRRNYY